MASEVRLHCHMSKQALHRGPEGQGASILALVQPAETLQALRFPLNVALVLDRSFSMRGARLQAVKDGVSQLVDALLPTDSSRSGVVHGQGFLAPFCKKSSCFFSGNQQS